MKADLSLALYEKYYSLKDRRIELRSKHVTARGRFVGFFKGEDHRRNYITRWRFQTDEGNSYLVEQQHIYSIYFLEDQTEINFTS